ncbi:MAG TPA: MucB/RseB C-terminal domain-containing protein [Steroidobacteraceae bacterium]|nr:MucB/RseB C-terminal domain-containing protein [Steroidobacteraceae bacterium]
MSERRAAAAQLLGCLLGAALVTGTALADDAARQWLAAMHEALAAHNYQGEFLHLANGRVEKLRIFHRVKDGKISERLVNLSGAGREFIRNGSELQCYLPDAHEVLVESEPASGTLLGTLPSFDASLESNYRLDLGERAMVLGRPARVLTINPLDGYRFGYRLWIDEANKMPVRTDLCDADGRMLEQVLFTSLKVGGALPDSVFHPDVDASSFAWVRQPDGTQHALGDALPWQLVQLPPGFHVSASSEQRLPGSDRPVTHLVLSDGLASVSVFIESPPAPPRQATEGQGRVGSAFVYSRVVAGHQVTAVGEVPPRTVELIAAGVAPAKPQRFGVGAASALAPPSQ